MRFYDFFPAVSGRGNVRRHRRFNQVAAIGEGARRWYFIAGSKCATFAIHVVAAESPPSDRRLKLKDRFRKCWKLFP